MKKKIQFFALLVVLVCGFTITNAQKQTSNRYFDSSKTQIPDTIQYEKILQYARILRIYYPTHHNDVFLLMQGLGEDQCFIFHLYTTSNKKGEVKKWCKIKIPINKTYTIVGFNPSKNAPNHKEYYEISCQTEGREIQKFIYDLDKQELSPSSFLSTRN